MDSLIFFGEFFKKMRKLTGLTLRQFCLENGLDPGNISKMERGLSLPPRSHEILERYATVLQIKRESDDWYEFFDLAAACAGIIPPDVMNKAQVVEKLPLVFRTLRGQKVPKERLVELAELIGKY